MAAVVREASQPSQTLASKQGGSGELVVQPCHSAPCCSAGPSGPLNPSESQTARESGKAGFWGRAGQQVYQESGRQTETTAQLPGDRQCLLCDQHSGHGGCGAHGFIWTYPLGLGEGNAIIIVAF